MRSPYSETNPGCRQENLTVISVMCIKHIQREEGREKSNVGGREGGKKIITVKLSFYSLQEPQA